MIIRIDGMVDPHVHLRDLDWAHKATFASETAAALAGGYWAVMETFQALGDTRPALVGGVLRLICFTSAAFWLSTQPWAKLEHLWWASAASALLQAVVALLFLRDQLARKLAGLTPRAPAVAPT